MLTGLFIAGAAQQMARANRARSAAAHSWENTQCVSIVERK